MNNALLIHAGALGDFILALRVVQTMKSAGADRVTILGRKEIASLALFGGIVDRVLDIDTGGYHSLFSDDAPVSNAAREALRSCCWAVSMLGGGPLIRRLREIGFNRVIEIDPRHRPESRTHITDQWLRSLQAAGITARAGPPRINVPSADIVSARRRLHELTRGQSERAMIVHPGSGSPRKCWPLEQFRVLARRFQSAGRAVVWLLGPAEAERLSRHDQETLADAAPIVADCPLAEIAALLCAAPLYIGNDSGITHLAAATGTRTIAIFGHSDPLVWAPLGANVTTVHSGQVGHWPAPNAVWCAAAEAG